MEGSCTLNEGVKLSYPDLGRPLGAGARGPVGVILLFCCALDPLILFLSPKSPYLLFLLSQKSQPRCLLSQVPLGPALPVLWIWLVMLTKDFALAS